MKCFQEDLVFSRKSCSRQIGILVVITPLFYQSKICDLNDNHSGEADTAPF